MTINTQLDLFAIEGRVENFKLNQNRLLGNLSGERFEKDKRSTSPIIATPRIPLISYEMEGNCKTVSMQLLVYLLNELFQQNEKLNDYSCHLKPNVSMAWLQKSEKVGEDDLCSPDTVEEINKLVQEYFEGLNKGWIRNEETGFIYNSEIKNPKLFFTLLNKFAGVDFYTHNMLGYGPGPAYFEEVVVFTKKNYQPFKVHIGDEINTLGVVYDSEKSLFNEKTFIKKDTINSSVVISGVSLDNFNVLVKEIFDRLAVSGKSLSLPSLKNITAKIFVKNYGSVVPFDKDKELLPKEVHDLLTNSALHIRQQCAVLERNSKKRKREEGKALINQLFPQMDEIVRLQHRLRNARFLSPNSSIVVDLETSLKTLVEEAKSQSENKQLLSLMQSLAFLDFELKIDKRQDLVNPRRLLLGRLVEGAIDIKKFFLAHIEKVSSYLKPQYFYFEKMKRYLHGIVELQNHFVNKTQTTCSSSSCSTSSSSTEEQSLTRIVEEIYLLCREREKLFSPVIWEDERGSTITASHYSKGMDEAALRQAFSEWDNRLSHYSKQHQKLIELMRFFASADFLLIPDDIFYPFTDSRKKLFTAYASGKIELVPLFQQHIEEVKQYLALLLKQNIEELKQDHAEKVEVMIRRIPMYLKRLENHLKGIDKSATEAQHHEWDSFYSKDNFMLLS